jgi:hypothetical protein
MKKVILLFNLLALFSCSSSSPSDSDVKEAARAAILQNLKSPTQTSFHHNEVIEKLEENTFQYKETINATNSFGGSIKQDATVKIKWLNKNPSVITNWSVIDIQFMDR